MTLLRNSINFILTYVMLQPVDIDVEVLVALTLGSGLIKAIGEVGQSLRFTHSFSFHPSDETTQTA